MFFRGRERYLPPSPPDLPLNMVHRVGHLSVVFTTAEDMNRCWDV